jgi:hypothetical protein
MNFLLWHHIPGSGVPWVNQHDVSGLNVQVGNQLHWQMLVIRYWDP